MAWFMCEQCGARVDAVAAPAECSACGKPSMVPAEGLRARKTFEEVAGLPIASEPTLPGEEQAPLASVTTQVESPQPSAAATEGPLIKPRTLELGEQDLIASPAPPPSPALAPRTTDELTESDIVEEKTAPPAAARERRLTGPLPPPFHGERRPPTGPFPTLRPRPPTGPIPPRPPMGPAPVSAGRLRVATLPLGSKPPTGPVAPWASRPPTGPMQPLPSVAPVVDDSPVDIEKLVAVAAPLPPPPRPLRALANQTERVAALKDRPSRRLRVACLLVMVAVVVGGGGYLLGTRRDAVQPAAVAARPDLAEPTLRIVQPSPDLQPAAPAVDAASSQPAREPVRQPRPAVAPGKPRRPAAQESAASLAEARAAYQEGLRKLLQGDGPEAVRLFNEALQKSGRFSLAYRGLGLAYEKMGRKEMARASFGRYLVLQPNAEDAAAIRQRIDRLQ